MAECALIDAVAVPLSIAGLFGVLGAAVRGERLGITSFWRSSRTLGDRAWGWVAYEILVGLSVGGAAVGLSALVGGLGFWLTGLAGVLMTPWMLRMCGGLFVDQWSWQESFRRSFHGSAYGAVLLGLVLSGIGVAGSVLVAVTWLRHSALGLLILLFLGGGCPLLVPLWGLVLYDTERRTVRGEEGGRVPAGSPLLRRHAGTPSS